MTPETIYPMLSKEGKSMIHIPNCGKSDEALSLDVVESLLKTNKYDASFSTGMSFIRRELYLLTKEEVKKKRFQY
jgi:hypothetical protein